MTKPAGPEHELDEHLRRTLTAVAATVRDDPTAGSTPDPTPIRSRRRRRLLVGAGVAIATIPLAAAAVVRFGPEYVDQIPRPDPIISGTLDGERYWVVDGRETPRCEGSPSGVELIAEENNLVGREWNTVGYFFGPPTREGCAPRHADVPPDYTYYSDGGSVVGDGMLWMGALHPEVDEVRATIGAGEPFAVDTFVHEGGTYYVLEVPPGTTTFTVDYLVEGDLVPVPDGESALHTLPED